MTMHHDPAWATATCETTTLTLWRHAVELSAIRAGADAEIVKMIAGEKLGLWFQAGEPVWMAAESLLFMAKQRKLHERADGEARALRHVIKSAR